MTCRECHHEGGHAGGCSLGASERLALVERERDEALAELAETEAENAHLAAILARHLESGCREIERAVVDRLTRERDEARTKHADAMRSMLWVVEEMSDSPRCFCLEESGRGRIDPWRATPIRDPAELAATLRPKDRIERDGCVPFVFGRDGVAWADRIRDGWRIVRRETLANGGES